MILWALFVVLGLFCRPWWGVVLGAVGMGVLGFAGASGQGLGSDQVVMAASTNAFLALVVGFAARFIGEKLWGKAIKPPRASTATDVLRTETPAERND